MHDSTARQRRMRQKRRAARLKAYEVWLPEPLVDELKQPDETMNALVARALEALHHHTGEATHDRPAATPMDTMTYASRREALVRRLRAMQAEGLSLQAMANRLQREGEPTLSGRGRWQKGTISDLLAEAEAVQP
jgi:hypothetical protein